MWDFTNAGAADADSAKADFGVRRLLDVTIYSIGFQYRRTRSVLGIIFGEADETIIYGDGCVFRADGDRLGVRHNLAFSVLSPVIALNTTYSYLITWNTVSGLIIYRDGVSWHTDAAFLTVPSVTAGIRTCIGSNPAGTLDGPPGQIGNIAVWPYVQMFGPDAVMWHNGVMPHRGSVRFFHRCIELPGKDEYQRQIPDCYTYDVFSSAALSKLPIGFHDSVSLYTDPSDDHYPLHGETLHSEMQTIAGEELHRRRLVKKSYQITVPSEFLAKDIGEDLQLTHKGGLECTGEGFGYGDAPERLVRIEGMALEPEDQTIGLTLRDIKRHAVSYYNAFRAPFTITGRQLGVFQLIPPYAAKETVRASYSWGKDIGGVYQEYGRDQEPLTGRGLLVESKKRNYVANAAFKWQLTSWNTIDPGTGTITTEAPTVKAIDNSIAGYAIKMVCGTPFAGNHVGIFQAVAGAGAGKDMTLSFIYYAETASPLRFTISRASDGWYLQTLTGGWAAPLVDLIPPLDTAYKEPYRYVLPYLFDGNDVYTFSFYSSFLDGKIIWMYHVQSEEGKFATGIVTGESGSLVVRQGSIVQLRNPNGLLLPKEHGTVAFEFEPEWDQDESTDIKFLMRLEHDPDDYIQIYWDTGATVLRCNWRYNGVNHFSSFSGLAWSAGDALKIAIRWLDDGELGKENAQGQLFAKIGSGAWQEAIAVEFTQELQEAAESILYIGNKGGVIDEHNAADGLVRYLHCFPEALPFEEIQALLGDPS